MSHETKTYEVVGRIHRDGEVYEPGMTIELTPEEAARINDRTGKPLLVEPGTSRGPVGASTREGARP